MVVAILVTAYLLYKKGKAEGSELKVQESLPKDCQGVDFTKINSLKQQLEQVFGSIMSYSDESRVLVILSNLKNDCEVLALYNSLGSIDGFMFFNGDLWYQIRRLSASNKAKARNYLFSYAKNII